MSIITVPAGLVAPAGCTIGQARYDLTESSDSTGSEAARLLGPPRWSMSLRSIDAMTPAEAGLWEAMLLQLRGRVNHLAAHDFGRPAPAGTLRGTPTLNASASAGATSVVLKDVRTGTNLLLYSLAFDNAAWVKAAGAVVTANTSGTPGFGTSADTLSDPSNTQSAVVRQSVTIPDDSATYTGSVYVKKTSGGTSATFLLQLALTGGSVVSSALRVNTDTGAILSGAGTVTAYGASWWRCVTSATNDASGNTTARLDLFPAINFYGLAGSDVACIQNAEVYGAQLELGAAATEYALPTLLAGDWLQIGTGLGTSQLVKVVAAATEAATGTMSVSFEPPLRAGFSAGDAVAWDKPLAYFKQVSTPSWVYRTGRSRKQGGFAVDLLESWS